MKKTIIFAMCATLLAGLREGLEKGARQRFSGRGDSGRRDSFRRQTRSLPHERQHKCHNYRNGHQCCA